MKRMKKSLLLVLLAIGFSITQLSAQVVVRVRPPRPHVVITTRPGPHHVWVREDWEPSGTEYRWHGGYWVEPPRPKAVWVPGHWRKRPGGYVWITGHWR